MERLRRSGAGVYHIATLRAAGSRAGLDHELLLFGRLVRRLLGQQPLTVEVTVGDGASLLDGDGETALELLEERVHVLRGDGLQRLGGVVHVHQGQGVSLDQVDERLRPLGSDDAGRGRHEALGEELGGLLAQTLGPGGILCRSLSLDLITTLSLGDLLGLGLGGRSLSGLAGCELLAGECGLGHDGLLRLVW